VRGLAAPASPVRIGVVRRLSPALALLALLVPTSASATAVSAQQISSNAVADSHPRVAANRVTWQKGTGTNAEIELFDGTTGDLTTNVFEDFDPEISAVGVIWKRRIDASNCMLMADDFGGGTPQPVDASFPCDNDIRVAGSHVSWTESGAGAGDDVFVTDGNTLHQLGLFGVDEDFARVGDVAGSPRAAWVADDDQLYYWDGSGSGAPIAPRPGPNESQISMQGGRVVWADSDGNDLEIWLYDGVSIQQLTDNDYDDRDPRVYGQHVVWTGFPDDPAKGEIFHYDGSTTEPITSDALDDHDPRVSMGADGVTIAWVKDDGNDGEIWMFDGCESTQISPADGVEDADVDLDGNRVAWVRGTGTNAEIWTATGLCDVACGNGDVEPGEECDDGNTVSGDGCSDACLEEICGNGRVDFGEECDDGNTVGADGCDPSCQLECGNGALDGAEECDDGNRDGGDGCDESCIMEVCGNGVVQLAAGEECDDGNLLSGDGCSSMCEAEQPAPKKVQQCIRALNQQGAALVKAQHQVNRRCLKDASKGHTDRLGVPPTAQACLTNDPKGKVAKAQAKTLKAETKKCDPMQLPGFAYLGSAAVNAAGVAEPVALAADLFGADLDLAVIPRAVDKKGARCQQEVAGAGFALSDRLFKLSLKEKKALLKGKEDGSLAISDEALRAQLLDFLAGEAAAKVAKKEAAVHDAARKSCGGVGLDAAFPGCAPLASVNALADCAVADARCRFCRGLDGFDGLGMDCDDFDDGALDASCP
jgi:cysteine-rich repeat protein